MNLTGEGVYQKRSKRLRKVKENDKAFLKWLRTLPCCVCNALPPSQAAHCRLGGRGGIGMKPLYSATPLCGACHTIQHNKSHLSIMTTDKWLELADSYLERFKALK